ncbi:MAG: hypothetical protein QME32_01885, partial [Endomicrobiia bacterium]|nr:hypothetical protein [Endomicrobiia bacterium]
MRGQRLFVTGQLRRGCLTRGFSGGCYGVCGIVGRRAIVNEYGGLIIVKGITGIKARVDTTADKDLNEVKFFVDGQEKYKISYDPRINCAETTVNPIGLGDDEFAWSNLDTAGLSDGTHMVDV